MAATEVDLGACVRPLDEVDWSTQEDAVVLGGVAAGIAAALAEARMRWPEGGS